MVGAETIRHAALDLAINGAAEFKQNMGEINRALKVSQAELNLVTSAYAKNEQNVQTLTAQKNHLNNAVKLNAEEQKRLNEELQRATTEYGENSREAQVLATKLANVEAKGNVLQRQLNDVTAALEEQERALRGQAWTELGEKMEAAGQRMQAAGQRMQDVGKDLSMKVTAPILAIGVAAIAVGADFDNSMGRIQARTGMTADETEKLSRAFRDMGVNGNYSAREIAAAFSYVAVSGQDASHGVAIMENAMLLAAATGNELGQSAYFLSNYLLKVGKDANDSEKYVNLFTRGISNTGISLAAMQNYMFRMTPAFQQFGASSETNVAIMTRLYQAGIRGANLYSGMGRIMMEASTASGNFADMVSLLSYHFEELNHEVPFTKDELFDLAIAMRDYSDQTAMAQLITGNLTDTQQVAWFEFMNLAEEIRDEVIPSFYEATAVMGEYSLASQMAAIQQDGLHGSAKRVRNSLEEIKLQIADELLPHAEMFVGTLGDMVQRFASLDQETQRTIIRLAGAAAAMGPVLIVGGKVVTTVGTITTGFGTMAKAIGAAGGAKAYFTAKFPLLTTAANLYTAANTKMKTSISGTTLATTTSTKAFGAKGVAMAGLTKANAAVTASTTAVTGAFTKMKLVMAANPLGLLITVIAVATAAMIKFGSEVDRVREQYREIANETDNLMTRKEQLAESTIRAAEAFQETAKQMETNQKHIRDMADSIEYLIGKQELTAGEMAMLEHYISELNNSIPGLTLAIDEYTGAMNMSVEALNDYINAAEKRATLDAHIAERTRLELEAIEIQREAITVAEQREALEEKISDRRGRNRDEHKLLLSTLQDLTEAEEFYKDALAANAEMQDALAQSVETYAQALEHLEQAQKEAAETASNLAYAVDDVEESLENVTTAMERHGITLEEWENAQSQALDNINSSYERYYTVAANAFRTVEEAAAVSVQSMTQNLQDNARAVEDWSKNIAVLVERGVDEGLIQQLRDGGVEMAATVRDLVNASDDELDALNYAFAESTRVALESMQRELDPAGVAKSAEELIDKVANAILSNQSMEEALVEQINTAFGSMDETITSIGFDGLGEDTVEGYLQGIENKQVEVQTAGQTTGENYSNALKDTLEQNSSSRVTERIGIGAVEGLIKGTEKTQSQAVETAKTLAKAFVNAIADKINQSQDIDNSVRRQVEDIRMTADSAVINAHFDSIGFEIANGVARGIDNGGGIVSNAAQSLINNALNAMRVAADISSPSRKAMWIADQIGNGLIIRMKAKGEELAEVCKQITKKVFDNLYVDHSKLITNAQDVLQSMQLALPALESNIKYTTSPQFSGAYGGQSLQVTVDMTGGRYYIREDADIDKLYKTIEKKLLKKLEAEGRTRR